MASGRMEFHSRSIMQHANFSFVLPNDVEMDEVRDRRRYERPTKSLILLHGLTGTDTDWLYGGVAQELAIQYNVAVFMPTAGNFFYLDRGYPGGNYGTFVGEEFPEYIRSVFGYCARREDTLIGGLSMGGYGALHTALAFPETFSACIALSSAIRIYALAKHGEDATGVMPAGMIRDVFGNAGDLISSDKNPEVQYAALREAGLAPPRIYLACGTEDMLLPANRRFRDFLTEQGADCCYEEGPGAHNWRFWNEYIGRGLSWALDEAQGGPVTESNQ